MLFLSYDPTAIKALIISGCSRATISSNVERTRVLIDL